MTGSRPSGLEGRCLCGACRYDTGSAPERVTICYCRFCQRATGSDRMILPVFERAGFVFDGAEPGVHTQVSEGSGKDVHIHFCRDCGTKLAVAFARWPDKIGIYSGTLDDPAAVVITPRNSKHIFVDEARPGTLLPAGVATYARHAAELDGTPCTPVVHDAPVATG